MSFDAEDYVARVLEEDLLPVVDSDTSKWAAVHDAQAPSAPGKTAAGQGYVFTVAWVLGITLGVIWVIRNGRTVFEQWQENVHRRANRRRHGIPDSDDRPFNVAYAAAALERRQREEKEKKEMRDARRAPEQHGSEWMEHGEANKLRQRSSHPAEPVSAPFDNAFPQGSSSHTLGGHNVYHVPNERSGHGTQQYAQQSTDPRAVQSYEWSARRQSGLDQNNAEDRARSPHPSARSSSVDHDRHRRLEVEVAEHVPVERRKHHEMDDTDDDDRLPKKSRFHGPSRHASLQVQKRGSKRHANEEDDDDWEMSQDKRARKGSAAHTPEADETPDVDMTQEESDAEPSRGTKRDREEADSLAESGPSDSQPIARPARKRRADRKEESIPQGVQARGRKRDRSRERSVGSDEEDENIDTLETRHKRGRRLQDEESDTDIVPADASESEAELSSDPACGGRRVGETWEINGQSFKVGLDGRRLRHALIKQSRTKFPMPKDSAHEDARTSIDVIVEKWLNDDEYKVAKEKFELAWQDASPVPTPEKPPVSPRHEAPPATGGKRLLWGGPPATPAKGRLSTPSSIVQNPFDLAPSNAGRRTTSVQLISTIKTETPKLRSSKSFSKWEKQDLEAISLKKMRARMEKQKAEDEAAAAAAKPLPPAPVPAPVPAPTPLTSTTNTQAQVPQKSKLGPSKLSLPPINAQPSLSFDKPSKAPESGTPATSTPTFSLGKPSNTSSGVDNQPPKSLTMTAAPQNSPLPSAPTTQPASKQPFTFNAKSPLGTTPPQAPAQPASAPPSNSFQLVPPTTSKPSFGPSWSETPKSAAPKTAFSFNTIGGSTPSSSTPSSQGPKSEAPKPAFSFNPGGGSTPSSEPGKIGIPNFFAKPTPQSPAPTAPTASTGGGAFAFNSGSQAAQGPKKSNFQFGVSGGQSNTPPSSGGGGSLLGRLGPSQGASQTTQAPSWPSTSGGQTTASPSPFGTPGQPPSSNPFGPKTPQSQPPSSNPFGQKVQQQQPTANKPTLFGLGANPSSEPAKSNPFGPQTSTPGGATSAFSFPKSSAQGDQPAKPSAFSFSPAPPGQQSTQPKPSFSFNFPSSTPSSSPQAPSANTTTPTANPFNPNPSSSTPNPFNPNPTPATANPFNPNPAATANPFNLSPAPSATNSSNSNPAPSTGAAPPQQSAFSFNFGKPTSSSTPTTTPTTTPFTGFGLKPAEFGKK